VSDDVAAGEAQGMSRVEHLREILSGLTRRMSDCNSDQNYTIMARERRAVLDELDALGAGDKVEAEETGLSEFERRLRQREVSA